MLNHNSIHAAGRRGARASLLWLALTVVGPWAAAPARAQTDEPAAAIVNGRRLTQQEVDDSIMAQLLPLQQQIYELRRKALENLIVKELLEAEAKQRGVSVAELRRQLTEGRVEVAPAEVEEVYAENAAALGAMSPDEARERIRLDLETQSRMRLYREALARLRERASVEVLLAEVRLPVADGDESFAQGPRGAPVTIFEFSDFQCPFCREVQPTLRRILQSYGGQVRLVFKHLPLTDLHPLALPAAQAAFCAGEQKAFWQYHDALFAADSLSPAKLDEIAARAGLSVPQFRACRDSERARAAVLRDAQEARRMGFNGTPSFLINGKPVSGAMSFDDFRRLIDQALKSASTASPSR